MDRLDVDRLVRDLRHLQPLRLGNEADPNVRKSYRLVAGDTGGIVSRTMNQTMPARRDWVRACIVGELIGFVPPAMTGGVLFAVDASAVVMIVGLVVAGIAEGVILGAFQSRVVVQLLPGVTGWTKATATAAGLAWLAGMGGSALVQALGPIGLLIATPAWIVGLLSMGFLQARRLAPLTRQAYRWVPATTAAWLVGVAIPTTTCR